MKWHARNELLTREGRIRDRLVAKGSHADDYLDREGRWYLDKVTGHFSVNETDGGTWRQRVVAPPQGIAEQFTFVIGGKKLTVPVSIEGLVAKRPDEADTIPRVSPTDVVLANLAAQHREALFVEDARLRTAAHVPEGATRLFAFDTWDQPSRSPWYSG